MDIDVFVRYVNSDGESVEQKHYLVDKTWNQVSKAVKYITNVIEFNTYNEVVEVTLKRTN